MTFDRLIYIDRLKDAGVDEHVARAHAEALRDALFETVATKTDIREVRSELHDFRTELKTDMHDLRTELKSDMQALRTELKSDMQALRTELKSDMHDLATSVDRKIEVLDRKIDGLDRKIEITARDLVIKGAGGLIVIASLMIGLKLVG